MAKEVTKRSDNYSQWYDNLVVKADLAERSAVRGCMVIKPYGYAIWEKMPFDGYGEIADYAKAREISEQGRRLMTEALDLYEKSVM